VVERRLTYCLPVVDAQDQQAAAAEMAALDPTPALAAEAHSALLPAQVGQVVG